MKQKKVLGKKLELNSKILRGRQIFKGPNHGFYNGKKINNLKNDIFDKISVQKSLY